MFLRVTSGSVAQHLVGLQDKDTHLGPVSKDGHGFYLKNPVVSLLTGTEPAAEESATKGKAKAVSAGVHVGVLHPGCTYRISFGNIRPQRQAVQCTVNSELNEYGHYNYPTLISGQGREEVVASIVITPFRPITLEKFEWLMKVSLIAL